MKQFVFIVGSLLFLSHSLVAQSGIIGNSNYSEDRQRQAREWKVIEDHYNNMKPSSTYSSTSATSTSGSSNTNNWADYSQINAQNAAAKRIQDRSDAFEAKVNRMNQLLKERNITLSKENWSKINQAGLDAGFDAYKISRLYGNYDPSYRPDYITDSNGNIITNPLPSSPKSIGDLNSSQRQNFDNYVTKAKAEESAYNKINHLQEALKIFESPKIQADIASLYIQQKNYFAANSWLFNCENNKITESKPSVKEIMHLRAYIHLIQGEYNFAETKYSIIYSSQETDKDIISETASSNFHLGNYDYVYDIMKNACENNPENKSTYTLAGAAVLAIDGLPKEAETLFNSIATYDKSKDLGIQLAKKLYDEVQTYRKQTGKISVVTIFLLDLAVMLDPKNIDFRAERYDSNAFLGRKKETVIDEPFLK